MPTTVWRPHRWTTAEFDALLAGGYLREGSRTFLWGGEIVDPMPEKEPHANAQDNLYDLILPFLPKEGWTVRPAHPVALKEGYKPQPDLVVLVGPRADYRRHTPTASDVALIIEIADTSYTVDAGEKLAEYANAGIPRYWIVNIAARRIEVYRDPATGHYATREDYPLDGVVPLILPRGEISHEFGIIPVMDVLRDSLEDS